MEVVMTMIGFGWGLLGVFAAFAAGKPGLWRVTMWLGPFAFFVVKPDR